jgi:hypothetical protein
MPFTIGHMPLYEIQGPGDLIPFRRLEGDALYEREIEDLFWSNPEEFIGEALFLVARQPRLPSAGIPDIVALDKDARVVIVEIKRDVDRRQLAQCLEYAGWARSTSLDELSSLYHGQSDRDFFADWQEFTGGTLSVINRSPRLVLVARDLHGRTAAALDFLMEGRLPLDVVKVSIYEDEQGRRFLDIEGEREPDLSGNGGPDPPIDPPNLITIDGRRVRMSDLLEAKLLAPGEELVWERPRLGVSYRASVADTGAIVLPDGRRFASPSRAAIEAAGVPACDGWTVWRLPHRDGVLLDDLRRELAQNRARVDQEQSGEEE